MVKVIILIFIQKKKKIDFISLFADQAYDIKIISDLKSEFKNKGFTKLWLNNKISTLHIYYL